MPNECMANDEHAVLLAKLDKTIWSREIIATRFGMDEGPLQNIFRRDRIEMRAHDRHAARILLEDLAPVQCGADHKVVFKNIFQ